MQSVATARTVKNTRGTVVSGLFRLQRDVQMMFICWSRRKATDYRPAGYGVDRMLLPCLTACSDNGEPSDV